MPRMSNDMQNLDVSRRFLTMFIPRTFCEAQCRGCPHHQKVPHENVAVMFLGLMSPKGSASGCSCDITSMFACMMISKTFYEAQCEGCPGHRKVLHEDVAVMFSSIVLFKPF